MTRTITALFDTRDDAEAGAERLRDAGIDASHVRVHDNTSHQTAGAYSDHQDLGLWGTIKNAFLPDADRHAYEEGVRRGGFLLTADVDDDRADDAVRALDDANSVDLDERATQWRSGGWTAPADGQYGTAVAGPGVANAPLQAAARADFGGQAAPGAGLGATATGEREQVIPIVEESLVVGKREVDRGSTRVRSYVTETPVSEQVRLRNERISVTRRAVDQPLTAADADAFRERSFELTATGEEAVVTKTARVVEEVVVAKTADERVETVTDTVRRTDVEIDADTDVEGSAPRRDDSARTTY